MAGIYIHVPFCIQKCKYCDFYSTAQLNSKTQYLSSLLQEIKGRAYELNNQPISTLYFGGGTPSLLLPHELHSIIQAIEKHFRFNVNLAEVTLECNPGDIGQMQIAELKSIGINRFSIGIQSFNNDALQYLGRRHTQKQGIDLFYALRNEGITNISLDLIYGIPTIGWNVLKNDVETLRHLLPEHISTYHLIIEEGTPFGDMKAKGLLQDIDEEISLQMSHYIRRELSDAGYDHYEISNFALPNFQSQHNSSYWNGTPYIGLGPSAHSYIGRWRSYNPYSLKEYTQQLLSQGFLVRSFEEITPSLAYEEYILTRLRTRRGIDITEVEQQFGVEKKAVLHQKLIQYCKQGLIRQEEESRYTLTSNGIDLSDRIMSDLF